MSESPTIGPVGIDSFQFPIDGRTVRAVRGADPRRRRYALEGLTRPTRVQLWNGSPADDGARLAAIARDLASRLTVFELVREWKGRACRTSALAVNGVNVEPMVILGNRLLMPAAAEKADTTLRSSSLRSTSLAPLRAVEWLSDYTRVALDIEQRAGWDTTYRDDARRAEAVRRWLNLLADLRDPDLSGLRADANLGMFRIGVPGGRGVFAGMFPEGSTTADEHYLVWFNRLVAEAERLREASDWIGPCCYWYASHDPAGRNRQGEYVRRQMDAALGAGRPVYAWVSPVQFWPTPEIVPAPDFAWLLETLDRCGADGVIVYTPAAHHPNGDEDWIRILRETHGPVGMAAASRRDA